MSGQWGNDKPEQKRVSGRAGTGWLRSPVGLKVWKFSSAGETLQSKWVQVNNADVVNGSPLIRHNRRMLRFSATQLWENLIRQGWTQVPLQWLVNNPLGRPRLWHVWRERPHSKLPRLCHGCSEAAASRISR